MMDRETKALCARIRTAKKTLSVEECEKNPVRIWRKRYALSQTQLGELFGVSGSCVGYWERGVLITPEWVSEIVSREADEYTLRKINKIKPQKYSME